MDRFRELENLDSDDQETVIKLVDAFIAFIVQHKMEGTLKTLRRIER